MPEEPPITNCIRRLRYEQGQMTQAELALRVNVTRQTILALEAGRYVPSLGLAFRIAEVFGLRVDEVFYHATAKGNLHETNPGRISR